jgi:SIT4 phosphatase-associated protein
MSKQRHCPRCIPLTHKIQGTAADVLKAIIAISANSSDAGVIGPNALSRELVSEATISRILDYMLDPEGLHSTASLTNCVALIIELIRKNNRFAILHFVVNEQRLRHRARSLAHIGKSSAYKSRFHLSWDHVASIRLPDSRLSELVVKTQNSTSIDSNHVRKYRATWFRTVSNLRTLR